MTIVDIALVLVFGKYILYSFVSFCIVYSASRNKLIAADNGRLKEWEKFGEEIKVFIEISEVTKLDSGKVIAINLGEKNIWKRFLHLNKCYKMLEAVDRRLGLMNDFKKILPIGFIVSISSAIFFLVLGGELIDKGILSELIAIIPFQVIIMGAIFFSMVNSKHWKEWHYLNERSKEIKQEMDSLIKSIDE